ncbi:helix-turn-helix domain-containing protein [Tepidanaerobacter acetatoxydans]|uniref:helix-turn-helix domain-containing protein n=1 Tax=Tepidanaerobacter acetatoxydans TaxID=499229 RepID=UPI003B59B055
MLGNRIKTLREREGLTQIEFAKILNISNTTLSQYESGQRVPSDEIKTKIADFFGVTIDFLLGRTDTPTPADKISESVSDDPELAKFWDELKEREDLQLLFKQTREMSPEDIKKIIRIIKAIEDEEAADDSL